MVEAVAIIYNHKIYLLKIIPLKSQWLNIENVTHLNYFCYQYKGQHKHF